MKKPLTAHLVFAATALATQQAWALGFGRSVADAVMGQTLTFTVPVSADVGERVGPECVSAQVYYGDNVLPAGAVRAQLLPGGAGNAWVVKVAASTPISEPIVEVALDVDCEHRFTRRFAVFADPPTLAATAAQVAPTAASAAVVPAVTARPAAAPASAPAANVSPRAAQPSSGDAMSGPSRAVHPAPTMASPHAPAAPQAVRHPAANNDKKPLPKASAPAPTARLVLDPGEMALHPQNTPETAPPAGPAAASGVASPASAGDGAMLRELAILQQNLDQVTRATQAQREQTAQLRAELARSQSRGDWLPWLTGLLAIAAAAIVALVWKLRQQTQAAHSDWYSQAALDPVRTSPPTPDLPAGARSIVLPTAMHAEPREPAARPQDEERPFAPSRIDEAEARDVFVVDHSATQPFDRPALGASTEEGAPREVSVEELLDLEQQADFFIALGQEDAAIDLLMSHLRSVGGQSPLPYTKLLEIYRRQGDRAGYERIRARFNRRFNAYAPDWDSGPTAGRSLEDYPEAVVQLQRVWHAPVDTMATLEAMLFKRDGRGELFDLPAYRDVLALYSLASDLWSHGGVPVAGAMVDVLLPLDNDPSVATAYPSAREINEHASEHAPTAHGADDGLDLNLDDASITLTGGMPDSELPTRS